MWRDFNLCQALNVTWQELQTMPEQVLSVWEGFLHGQAQARKELADARKR